jgi:hypothetical protein
MDELVVPPGAFRRLDEEDDRGFYGWPRRVVHLDAAALAALTRLYGAVVTPTGCVLDLMASWRSHLPPWFRGTASDAQHVAIVTAYFRSSGSWGALAEFAHTPPTGDPLYAVWGLKT